MNMAALVERYKLAASNMAKADEKRRSFDGEIAAFDGCNCALLTKLAAHGVDEAQLVRMLDLVRLFLLFVCLLGSQRTSRRLSTMAVHRLRSASG